MQDIFIKDALSLVYTRFFPSSKKYRGKYLAIIGLGSNVGDSKGHFKRLFILFMKDKRLRAIKSSPILINKAFGYKLQRDFHNSVMMIATSLHARALLKLLFFYEFKFRRKKSFKNAPRSLDLDLLYFSEKSYNTSFCTLPHPGAHKRNSVILPLGMIL